jgi:hemerythrin-like metal-binding protein
MSLLEIIKFDDSYRTGIDIIDEQHKKLINIINKLITAMKLKVTNSTLDIILSELTKYIDYHFSEEEKLFKNSEYNNIDNHMAEHKYYISKVQEFNKKFKENKTLGLSIVLLGFLSNWIKHHIKEIDIEYISYIK